MKDDIKQKLIDWQWHNCVPEHRAYDMPKNNVFCVDCMVAFVKADRLKRHLTSDIQPKGKTMIKTKIFASISSETAYEKGEQIGLTGEALNMFRHFNEIELEIKVDDDGVVRKVKALL